MSSHVAIESSGNMGRDQVTGSKGKAFEQDGVATEDVFLMIIFSIVKELCVHDSCFNLWASLGLFLFQSNLCTLSLVFVVTENGAHVLPGGERCRVMILPKDIQECFV